MGARRWCAIAIGFGGVLLILQLGTEAVDPDGHIGVLSALICALSVILTRKIGASQATVSLLISQAFVYFAVSGMAGVLMREWAMPTLEYTLLPAGCGIIAAIAFYCLTQACRIAPPRSSRPSNTAARCGASHGDSFSDVRCPTPWRSFSPPASTSCTEKPCVPGTPRDRGGGVQTQSSLRQFARLEVAGILLDGVSSEVPWREEGNRRDET